MITRLFRTATLFSAFTVLGCSSDHHCSAPQERKVEVEAAASMWNAVSNETIFIVDEYPDCYVVFTDHIDHPNPNVRGMYDGYDTIYVHTSLKRGSETIMVTAHEFGHLLGLKHHSRVGIMKISALKRGDPFEISPADMAECRRAGACE